MPPNSVASKGIPSFKYLAGEKKKKQLCLADLDMGGWSGNEEEEEEKQEAAVNVMW